MTLPVAASRAANRLIQEFRGTYSCGCAARFAPGAWAKAAAFDPAPGFGSFRRRKRTSARSGGDRPDNVAHLLDERRIGRELEGLGAVRLEVEGFPDPMDRRGREALAIERRLQCVESRGVASSV